MLRTLHHRSRKFFSILIVVALLNMSSYAQGFQPMRLLSGLFRIAGDAASRIPAACMDEDLALPSGRDFYRAASDGVFVTRVEGNSRVTKPLNEALQEWLKISGDDSTTALKVEPIRKQPQVSYLMNVRRPSVVTAAAPEIAPLIKVIRMHERALARVDTFR